MVSNSLSTKTSHSMTLLKDGSLEQQGSGPWVWLKRELALGSLASGLVLAFQQQPWSRSCDGVKDNLGTLG